MLSRGARRRGGFSALETMTVIAGLCVFLGIASMAYFRHQARVHQRICFQQQRNLQGQLEAIPSADLDVSVEELFGQLIKAGLISGQLSGSSAETVQVSDPGQGNESFKNYMLMPGSKMFGCKVHGSLYSEDMF